MTRDVADVRALAVRELRAYASQWRAVAETVRTIVKSMALDGIAGTELELALVVANYATWIADKLEHRATTLEAA